MTANFPDTPAAGETFTAGGPVWQWDGVKWVAAGTIDASLPNPPITVLSASAALPAGTTGLVLCNPGAPMTVTLPPLPGLGQQLTVKDAAGTAGINPITVAGGGSNIEGSATMVLGFNYGWAALAYSGMQWVQVALLLMLLAFPAWAQQVPNPMANDAANAKMPQAANNLTANATAHTYYAQAYGSCTPDIGACVNAAGAAANAAGGGTVVWPAGEFLQSTPIIYLPKVSMEGAGWGDISASTCGTKVTWNGAAGGVMVQAGDLAVDAAISGLGFKKVCLDGNGVAANGLKLINAQKGQWSNFFLRNFTGCALLMDATASTGPSGNLIENFQINQNFAGAGRHGMCFGPGSAHGDVFSNQFIGGVIVTADGNGLDCRGADTNSFHNVRFTTTGTGRAGVFYPGTAAAGLDGWCRRNFFVATLWQGGGLQVQSGVRASSGNMLFGFKRGDGEILPEIQPYVLKTTGNSHTSTTLDGLASVAGVLPGMPVSGSGIAPATTVASVAGSAVTLSAATTNSVTGLTVLFGGPADLYCVDTNQFSCGTPLGKFAAYAPVQIETTTSARQLTENDCGSRFTNRGATVGTTQTFVLPASNAGGCNITFVRFPISGSQVVVQASHPDTISAIGRNSVTSPGGTIATRSRYATIRLVDQGLAGWSVTEATGPWLNDLGGMMSGGGNVWLTTLDAVAPGLTFTGLPTGATLFLDCSGLVPAVDAGNAILQVSTDAGATWKTASYSYTVAGQNTAGAATAASNTAGANIQLNAGSAIDASAANPISLQLYIHNGASTTLNKNIVWTATYNNNTPVFETVRGAGKYTGDQAAVTGVRITPSSGAWLAGECSAYGLVAQVAE